MAWFTTKTGKHINTDWFDDDVKRKSSQIAFNKQQSTALSAKDLDMIDITHYPDMRTDSNAEKIKADRITREFIERTGIQVDDVIRDRCAVDTLSETFKVIEDIQSKYPDVRLKRISVRTDNNASASMSEDYVLSLNVDVFKYSVTKLNEYYKDCIENDEYPKGKAIPFVISHEYGHAIHFYNMKHRIISEKGIQNTAQFGYIVKYLEEHNYNKYITGTYNNFVSRFENLISKNHPSTICKHAAYHKIFDENDNFVKVVPQDYHETIADAFADVYMNKSKAAQLSLDLYDWIFS